MSATDPGVQDALILGAGPAGCAAAITFLRAGGSVTVLEADISSRRIPGETLHPAVEPIFKQLEVWDEIASRGFHRHTGIWREDMAGTRTFDAYGRDADGEWHGLQADRAVLNQILRGKVSKLGGKFLAIGKLTSIHRRADGEWRLIADGNEHAAGMVFDGAGKKSWLAQQLGIHIELCGPSQRLSFGWNSGTDESLRGNPIFTQQPDGWDWHAPLGGGHTAWVRLRRSDERAGMDATWRICRACAGPGYYLLGDAAFYMDPSAANGVLRAMMSGIHAADLASKVAKSQASVMDAAHEYQRWVSILFDTTYQKIGA